MEGGPSSMINYANSSNEDQLDYHGLLNLPPGFRFHPTDLEIIMHYLLKKVMDKRFSARAIGEADFNKCEPWDLPKKAKMGEKEWYFFFQRDRKYPTGMRTNRATESGYWKATGKDKEIYKAKNCLVGMKKTLVFYKGRAPKGEKTNWVMHEYRLEGNFSTYNFSRTAKEEWVVSRVLHKNIINTGIVDSFVDHLLGSPTLPAVPLTDYSCLNQIRPPNTFTTHDPNFFPQMAPHNPFPYQVSSSLGYEYENGIFPFEGVNDQVMTFERLVCKKENFSTNNSAVSHSQETGISTQEMANHEITSMNHIQTNKQLNDDDDDQQLEGLAFSPDMSDLDSLWTY
ncbi:hypothetical protein RD792_012845 [Penstemon davidsonii]|uniref:NAC domain-containing protein n=1 Tax=Penstemon davidsonii TaxID=160366 RepID=A0ABR0CY12_9LAMI|nr:hypothetical protein RD792_012845 [Penstemon davidsonii]